MYIKITRDIFIEEMRRSFSPQASSMLFDYLEALEDKTGVERELGFSRFRLFHGTPIDIRYKQHTLASFNFQYSTEFYTLDDLLKNDHSKRIVAHNKNMLVVDQII